MDTDKTKLAMELYKNCFSMPKVELHAHLNGCIRVSTLVELCGEKGIDLSEIGDNFGKDLDRCFKTFQIVHQVCDSLKVIERITKEIIEDFASENVTYLELRTTPKAFPKEGTTIEAYLKTVVGVMRSFEEAENFKVRLIVSINRASPFATAEEIINTAIALKPALEPFLVGVDFGGNPSVSGFKDFEPLFTRARDSGIKVTIHTAEIVNYLDNDSILAFRPDRIGHGVLLNDKQIEEVKALKIPIEFAPTNYTNTLKLGSYLLLPNMKWMKDTGHPFSLCTDDTILFRTNATSERFEVAFAFGFTFEEMQRIEEAAVNIIFDESLKPWLLSKLSH